MIIYFQNHFRNSNQHYLSNRGGFDRRRSKRSVSKPRHVEVLLVADRSMTDFHDQGNLETYLLTIMNMVYLTMFTYLLCITHNISIEFNINTSTVAQYLTNFLYFSQGIITVYGPINRQLHQSSRCEDYSSGRDAISFKSGSVIKCRRDLNLLLQVAAKDEP